MSNRRGLKIVLNIILIIALIFLLLLLLGTVLTVQDDLQYAASGGYGSVRLKVTGEVTMEKLGEMYEGNADRGYTFYKIQVPVTNTGTMTGDADYNLYYEVEGRDYSDVKKYDSSAYEDDFYYENTAKMPPATETNAECIVQIKDGVSEFDFIFYECYDDYYEEENAVVCHMQVPMEEII